METVPILKTKKSSKNKPISTDQQQLLALNKKNVADTAQLEREKKERAQQRKRQRDEKRLKQFEEAKYLGGIYILYIYIYVLYGYGWLEVYVIYIYIYFCTACPHSRLVD